MADTKTVVEKAVVFLDIQNLYHSSLNFGGAKVSYRELMTRISKDRDICFARAYAAHRNPKAARPFYKALESLRIDVKSRFVQIKKGDTKSSKIIPVHFDVEIAVDAMSADVLAQTQVDTVVLCSGNGSFDCLVDALLNDGFKVEVWSFRECTSERLLKKVGTEGFKFVQIDKNCLLSGNETEKIEATNV